MSSIYSTPPGFEFETIVVDNASTDGSVNLLREEFPYVRLIKNVSNVGFARASNQAISRSRGEYILFLNPDAVPESGALERIVKFMEQKPHAGCVGGKLLNPDGSLQLSCRSFPTYISIFFGRLSLIRRIFPGNPFSKGFLLTDLDYNKEQKVDWIIGACMLTKREILETFGYFDEDFFIFVEDLDFCYRLKKGGLDIYYFPGAVFYHQLGASTSKYWLNSIVHHNFGMYKFFKKQYQLPLIFAVIASLGLVLRVFFIVLSKLVIKSVKKC
ncbi:MAG: glycosyltransferase family 2 protein [bacterium]|nr:glycosyltransferase family 2 protein [bacterium]